MGQQIEFALRQSMHRVLVVLVSFLPGLFAFLVAVILFALVGAIIAGVFRWILTITRFDERLGRAAGSNAPASLFEWTSNQPPSRLVSRAIFWLCTLVGVAVGISAFGASYSSDSQVPIFLLPYLTHVIGAVLILLCGHGDRAFSCAFGSHWRGERAVAVCAHSFARHQVACIRINGGDGAGSPASGRRDCESRVWHPVRRDRVDVIACRRTRVA